MWLEKSNRLDFTIPSRVQAVSLRFGSGSPLLFNATTSTRTGWLLAIDVAIATVEQILETARPVLKC
jgi:hypothetical protein